MMHYLCLYIEGIHALIKTIGAARRVTMRWRSTPQVKIATLPMAGANRRKSRDRQNEWKNGRKDR
jgi:hypothetical protein